MAEVAVLCFASPSAAASAAVVFQLPIQSLVAAKHRHQQVAELQLASPWQVAASYLVLRSPVAIVRLVVAVLEAALVSLAVLLVVLVLAQMQVHSLLLAEVAEESVPVPVGEVELQRNSSSFPA